MTIISAPGLYIGWDECSVPFTVNRYPGSLYIELGRLVIGIEFPRK